MQKKINKEKKIFFCSCAFLPKHFFFPMALSAEGVPGKKWLSEWFTGLSQQESDELTKKFNTSSVVSELGNFDARKKEHLRKIHEIAQ